MNLESKFQSTITLSLWHGYCLELLKSIKKKLHFSEGYVFIGPQTLLITFLLSISRAGYSCLSNLLLNRPPWFQQ